MWCCLFAEKRMSCKKSRYLSGSGLQNSLSISLSEQTLKKYIIHHIIQHMLPEYNPPVSFFQPKLSSSRIGNTCAVGRSRCSDGKRFDLEIDIFPWEKKKDDGNNVLLVFFSVCLMAMPNVTQAVITTWHHCRLFIYVHTTLQSKTTQQRVPWWIKKRLKENTKIHFMCHDEDLRRRQAPRCKIVL